VTIKNSVDGQVALIGLAVLVLLLLELLVVLMFVCRSTMPREKKHLAGS
jgi:hypothetical protein